MVLYIFLAHVMLLGTIVGGTNNTANCGCDLEDRVAELEARLADVEGRGEGHTGSRGKRYIGNVAFSVMYTSNSDHHNVGEVVKFTNVLSNYGSAYSTSTGLFTAPNPGVYFFIYHFAHLWHTGQAWLQLTHEGRLVNMAASDVIREKQDVQGSNSAIIHLDAGERVWLQYIHQSDTGLYGSREFTTFSGVLLF